VIQSDLYNDTHASITICPVTADCVDAPLFRIALPPGQRTGLPRPSQVMVDKVVSVPRESLPIGRPHRPVRRASSALQLVITTGRAVAGVSAG
jgi:mRNA-degrading endonuclease toxin of MazEF toxin-antitoxin module